MITCLISSAALAGIAWLPRVAGCAVEFAWFAGGRIGREPWVNGWSVLHVPDLAILRVIVASADNGAAVLARGKAVERLGAEWPVLEVLDETGKPTGTSMPRGLPHIAGFHPLDSWGEIVGYVKQSGKVVSLSAVASRVVL